MPANLTNASQNLIDEMQRKGVTAVRFYWGPIEDDCWTQIELEQSALPGDSISVPRFGVGNS